MGLALFFFHYTNHVKDEIYRDYAFELLERVQERIHEETPIDYENGLSGIGCAIEFLVRKGYIEADTDEILEDFDERIFSVRNISDLSIEDLAGIAYYAIWRISGGHSKKKSLINDILPPIVKAIDGWRSIHKLRHPVIDSFKDIIETETTGLIHELQFAIPGRHRLIRQNGTYVPGPDTSHRLLEIMSKNDIFTQNNLDLGFRNGLAGIGMTLLSELDNDKEFSWTSLLPGVKYKVTELTGLLNSQFSILN